MFSLPVRPLWQGRSLALIGIVLLAFSMRTAVASLSPLYARIEADFAVSSIVVGLIGTAPAVGFAVFGILTPALERRFGLERLAVAALVAIVIGLVARALSVDATMLLASSSLVFAGIGVGNVLLPPLVRAYFPDRIGLMMTVYTTTVSISTFLPPLIAVPVADATGWRASLGLWAVFALAGMIPWLAILARRDRRSLAEEVVVESANPRVLGRLWRLPLAWSLTTGFAVAAVVAYTVFAWFPTLLQETAGVDAATAGAILGLFSAIGLPASLIVPTLVVRYNATGPLFVAAIAASLAGLAGLLLAPAAAPLLWMVLLGVNGLVFAMMIVLIGLRTRTHEGSVALSGFVQSVGFGIAAVFPIGVGLVHDATGSWVLPLVLLALAVIALIPAAVIAARPHTIEDEWERRHGAW